MDEVRATLQCLIDERGDDYSSLSRLIGRNAAYVQQFIKRGVPRRLAEQDRRLLARYFQVSEERLGGPPEADTAPRDLVMVPRIEIGASAGAGALNDREKIRTEIAFDARWLRTIVADAGRLSVIRVQGDSMVPTLADGDEIVVDGNDAAQRLRDGIYVLRADDALIVKRLALNPLARTLSIKSDNPAYPGWPECDLRDLGTGNIDIVGRVVWVGRRVA